jgi:hypothetical protein
VRTGVDGVPEKVAIEAPWHGQKAVLEFAYRQPQKVISPGEGTVRIVVPDQAQSRGELIERPDAITMSLFS